VLIKSRLLCEIEQTLKKGIDIPSTEYDKKAVEEHKLEIQEILGIINLQSLPPVGNLSVVVNPTLVAHAVSGATISSSVVESGTV